MGANVTRLLEVATWLEGDGDPPRAAGAFEAWGKAIREAAGELQTTGSRPGMAERLERCRDRAAPFIATLLPVLDVSRDIKVAGMIEMVEDCAHAMLAASRPASGASPPDIRDDPPAYNLAHRHGQASGARRALGALVEMTKLRGPEGLLTMSEIREWAEKMKQIDWSDGDVEGEG